MLIYMYCIQRSNSARDSCQLFFRRNSVVSVEQPRILRGCQFWRLVQFLILHLEGFGVLLKQAQDYKVDLQDTAIFLM